MYEGKLFIDECGYTGEDLFNEDQPVFVLASLYLSEEYCKESKNRYFYKIKARELKHSRLSKYPSQQKIVIDFLRDMSKKSDSIKFAVAHKHYVLVTKIVDIIIEPMAYEDGLDFYKDGLNIAFSNLLFYLTKSLAGEAFFKKMIYCFQKMMRERSFSAYKAFFSLFYENNLHKELEEIFIYFKAHHVRYGFNFLKTVPNESLDIAFSEAVNLVSEWSKDIQRNFVVYHDVSSNMAKNKKAWDRIVNPDIPEKVVGYDKRKMYFPIRAEKTVFANSYDYAGLQLVDILAGAMARCMKWYIQGKNDNDEYGSALASFLPELFGGHVIWPTTKVTPEELGTIGPKAEDAIEHFINLTRDIIK